jgi:hypothetical protein
MNRKITKTNMTITLDKNVKKILDKDIINKSKYIEWLIYQDLKINSKNDKINQILI